MKRFLSMPKVFKSVMKRGMADGLTEEKAFDLALLYINKSWEGESKKKREEVVVWLNSLPLVSSIFYREVIFPITECIDDIEWKLLMRKYEKKFCLKKEEKND